MVFYYNGKKPSKGFDIAQGCLLFIALGAIVLLFTLIDSFKDLEGHYLQLFFMLLMASSIFYGVFKKKGKFHTHKIELKNTFLHVNNLKVPLNEIQLDIYKTDTKFSRYHLWDKKGIISIYSVYKDNLQEYFSNNFPDGTFEFEEISSTRDGANIHLKTNKGSLNYDLESGGYSIKIDGNLISSKTPELFVYDPKYKQSASLTENS